MPLYCYVCNEHGGFDALGNVATSGDPAPCPTCAKLSKRVIVAAETRRPYTEKFDGRHYYPNVNKHFNSHKEYERYLKETGREICTDRKHDEDIGHMLRPNEKRKRGKTLYFT